MDQPIEQPLFALSIHTMDGFEVSTPRSRDVNCVPEKLEGCGVVELDFESLNLLPGTYDVTVALTDQSQLHTYDNRVDILRIDVDRGVSPEEGGVVSLGGRWTIRSLGGD